MTEIEDGAALLAKVDEERERARKEGGRAGPKPGRATTPDARLVARVCAALGVPRARLLPSLGYKPTWGGLSRCNGPDAVPLTEQTRERLRALLEGAKSRAE